MIISAPRSLPAIIELSPTELTSKNRQASPLLNVECIEDRTSICLQNTPKGCEEFQGVSRGTLTRLELLTMDRVEKELWPKKLPNSLLVPDIEKVWDWSRRVAPKFSGQASSSMRYDL
jgi:hypothetical protein